MSDSDYLDSLMMHADLANKEARERFTCAVCNPDVPDPDVDWCDVCKRGGMTKFKVTGVLRNGRRFKAIHTDSRMDAMMINLWRGSVWQSQNGKWKLVHRVFN